MLYKSNRKKKIYDILEKEDIDKIKKGKIEINFYGDNLSIVLIEYKDNYQRLKKKIG